MNTKRFRRIAVVLFLILLATFSWFFARSNSALRRRLAACHCIWNALEFRCRGTVGGMAVSGGEFPDGRTS